MDLLAQLLMLLNDKKLPGVCMPAVIDICTGCLKLPKQLFGSVLLLFLSAGVLSILLLQTLNT